MIYFRPDVELRGMTVQTDRAISELGAEYDAHGYDLWITCVVDPHGLHEYGQAVDGDASTDLPHHVGVKIERGVARRLSPQYFVTWHQGTSNRWHHHIEFDPENRGVAPYLEA
jgi:hypothetical protein